jgi:hypothetical protein
MRHGMEYLLILTLWSKSAELPMKLTSRILSFALTVFQMLEFRV